MWQISLQVVLFGTLASIISTVLGEKFFPVHYQPEQIHLSLGQQSNEIVVTWVTMDKTADSIVHYGIDSFNLSATGTQQKFVDGGLLHRHMFIHRVYLRNLMPNTTYNYHCGCDEGWSSSYHFTTFPSGEDWSPRFVIYGDLGNKNGQTMGMLQEAIQTGQHDLITHVGDFAYDMHDNNAKVGDEFMREIESIAAYVPYQTVPGNHERAYNYSNYNARFSMHSQGDSQINNHYWTYKIGPVRLIAINTDFWKYFLYGKAQVYYQFKWLEEQLIDANKPENRKNQPWVIVMGHHPMYYQKTFDDMIRKGEPNLPALEKLLYQYGVDLTFWGHDHIYTRMYPVYDSKVYNGSLEEPYRNPKAPVHITTGSAGCQEYVTPVKSLAHFAAFSNNDYGFTYMTVHNASHVHIQQISKNQGGKVVDDLYLIKDKHGPEAWL